MTHTVLWYPSVNESHEIVKVLDKYSDFIELQFPFSDPIADWPLISAANKISIENWMTPEKWFWFIDELMSETPSSKILIMTYFNIVYRYGIEKFIKQCSSKGIYGCIIPDIPLHAPEFSELHRLWTLYGVNIIQILSPKVSNEQIQEITKYIQWFVYAISQDMTTWNKWLFWDDYNEYISRLRKKLPIWTDIWVGFWIKTNQDVSDVLDHADFAIIGSELIKKYDEKWLSWLEDYLQNII